MTFVDGIDCLGDSMRVFNKNIERSFEAADAFKRMINPVVPGVNLTKFLGAERGIFGKSFPELDFLSKFGLSHKLMEQQQRQLRAIERAFKHPAGWDGWLAKVNEEERIAALMTGLGLVPHWGLWPHADELPDQEMEDGSESATHFANRIWPQLRLQLELDDDMCLSDSKLHTMHSQMLDVHHNGSYEATLGLSIGVIERAVNLGRCEDETNGTRGWLKDEVGKLPLSYVRHSQGFRVWGLLLDDTFANCWTDADADNTKYPNRHAVAHGRGTRLATVLDSLNAILLASFAIDMVRAVEKHRCDIIEWSLVQAEE